LAHKLEVTAPLMKNRLKSVNATILQSKILNPVYGHQIISSVRGNGNENITLKRMTMCIIWSYQ